MSVLVTGSLALDHIMVFPDRCLGDGECVRVCPHGAHALFLDEAGGFDEAFPTSEDYGLWLRIAVFHQVVRVPEVLAFYQNLVNDLSTDLAQFERIKKIALLPQEFTLEAGELTPTLKVKRRFVEQKPGADRLDVRGCGRLGSNRAGPRVKPRAAPGPRGVDTVTEW